MSSDLLRRIKRAVLAGNYVFSQKAFIEMEADCLTELDVAESILNAVAIYTKGKLVDEDGVETYYFLISSKKAL